MDKDASLRDRAVVNGAACGSAVPASVPSALSAWWPIPFHRETDGLFCDAADEGAAVGLLTLMTGLSEEHWCAGWLTGLEWSLWDARENGPRHFGMGQITERQCQLLRLLSEEANGWWHYVENEGPRFAPLPEWRLHAQAMAARSGETTGSPEGNSAVRQDAPEEE